MLFGGLVWFAKCVHRENGTEKSKQEIIVGVKSRLPVKHGLSYKCHLLMCNINTDR